MRCSRRLREPLIVGWGNVGDGGEVFVEVFAAAGLGFVFSLAAEEDEGRDRDASAWHLRPLLPVASGAAPAAAGRVCGLTISKILR